jgi:lysophospholipase L1-like esterase
LVKPGQSIAFLGDSITYFGAENPGGYVRLVASGLAAQGVNVTAINAGWGGNTSKDMLGRLDRFVLSKKPTWMTLSAGVNDVMHSAVELEEYKTAVTAILDRAQQAGIKVVVLTATQIGLPVTGSANVKLAGYNTFLRETAKARDLPLADVNAAMAAEQASFEKAGIKRVLTTDGVHMNVYGNIVMAKCVLATLGLDERQLAVVEAKWNETPELFQATAKVKLSVTELAALEAYAASQHKSVEKAVAEISTKAVNAALEPTTVKAAAVKPAAVKDAPAHVNSAAVPTNRGTEEYHQALNAQAKKGNIDLLFVGDSITMAWRSDGRGIWDERYVPLKAANFGLGGDKTEHVLWRLQNGNLEGIKPKVVVLLIGTNNVGRISSEDLAGGITAIVKEINTRLPESKVLLMGLFPRGETPDHSHRIQVTEVNKIISKLDDGKRVFFTDIGSQMMLPDGNISKEYLPDLLHLSGKGYKLWADSIQAKIDKFMK